MNAPKRSGGVAGPLAVAGGRWRWSCAVPVPP